MATIGTVLQPTGGGPGINQSGTPISQGPNGVFWRGADGQVWVKGSGGVNTAGAWDANTAGYWGGKGFKEIADPNPAKSSSNSYGGGSSSGRSGTSSSNQQAANLQIDQINRLLGNIDAQERSGLDSIEAGYASQQQRLADQQAKANRDFGIQSDQNARQKQQGLEQVDDFAYNTYNSLQQLLRGAGAGKSSVARDVVPDVVAQGATTRRKGVFDTAGENEANIALAKGDAEDQFRMAREDLSNQRNSQKSDFLRGLTEQRMDLLGKRAGIEQDAGRATGGTQAELDNRANYLQSLFGQYAPSYTAKAVNLKAPELSKYQIDPASIRQDQNTPAETRSYLAQLKKREEMQ